MGDSENKPRVRLTLAQTMERIGVGRTAFWKLRRDDETFPRPYSPTGGRDFYWSDEIDAWMRERQSEAA